MEHVKALIFDAYGTLISTGNGSVMATAEILRKRRCSHDAALVYARWKQVHREHVATLDEFVCERDIFGKDLRRLYEEFAIDGDPEEDVTIMLATLGKRTAFPETTKVLDLLRTKYRLYIGSNSDE